MACPAALIPCRGINSVRTWSRSLLTLCIQATSTANHLAKEIGRDQRPAKSAEKQTMSLRSEVSLSCRNLCCRWVAMPWAFFATAPRLPVTQKHTRPKRPSNVHDDHISRWRLRASSVTNDSVPFMTWNNRFSYGLLNSPSKECENKSQNVETKWLYFDLVYKGHSGAQAIAIHTVYPHIQKIYDACEAFHSRTRIPQAIGQLCTSWRSGLNTRLQTWNQHNRFNKFVRPKCSSLTREWLEAWLWISISHCTKYGFVFHNTVIKHVCVRCSAVPVPMRKNLFLHELNALHVCLGSFQ